MLAGLKSHAKIVTPRSLSAENILSTDQPNPPSVTTKGRFTVVPSQSSEGSDSGVSVCGEPSTMDRSTQVNFPIVLSSTVEHWKRAIRRHQTLNEINGNNNKPLSAHSSWNQIKPKQHRPRSLNNTSELFQKSKFAYHSDNNLTMPAFTNPNDFLTVTLRDKTSAHSTITSTSGLNMMKSAKNSPPIDFLTPPRPVLESCNGSNKSSCRCMCPCEEEREKKQKANSSTTPEGLSWRRLHMSRAKLKATATTSELLSGFAMVAMVELQINEPTSVPEWLFVMFAVCTTVLVAVHIFALMISTYILPNIDAISKLDIAELVTESPHERMRGFIELAWAFSTILGLFLFLVEVAILCWVKFWDYSFTAAIAATVIVIPVLVIFVLFAMHFYHSLVVHRCQTSVSDMETLENMKKQLDEVTTSPV